METPFRADSLCKEDRGSGEEDAFLRNILFPKLPERSSSFPFQRPLCLPNACLPFFDTARLKIIRTSTWELSAEMRPGKGIRETLLFVLTPHSFRQRKTAHKEARESCFWMKGRIVAEVPAGVQYRVARLSVNWRGRLARKTVLRRFPAVARYRGTAGGRCSGSGFQLQGGQCQPLIHEKARRQIGVQPAAFQSRPEDKRRVFSDDNLAGINDVSTAIGGQGVRVGP